MSATLQGLAPTKAVEPAIWLNEFLSENRGVLRFMETKTDPTSRGRNLLVIESARSDRSKDPARFPITDADDAARAYELIVDYFNRYEYNEALFFEENKISLSLSYGNFSKKTADLRRDLGLLESELSPMYDYTKIDFNAEVKRLCVSPAGALRALQKAAAQEASKRAATSRRLKWGWHNRPYENPAAFAWRAYQAEAKAGTLHLGVIRQDDKKNGTQLADKLVSWLRSPANRQQVPEGFDIPTKPEWITRQLKNGEPRPELRAVRPRTQEQRLYDAAQARRSRKRGHHDPAGPT